MWSPLDYSCTDGPKGEDCNPYCLYDIVNDLREKKDLTKEQPDLLQKMLDRYNALSKEPHDIQDQGCHSDEEPKMSG